MSTLKLNGKDLASQTSSAEPVIASTVTGGAGLSGMTSLGTVTTGTLESGVILTSFVGMIAPFAMTSVPTGWLVCDGSAVSRTVTYSALFSAIGTTWGVGDGSSTFNVPDLEGAFLRGTGSHATSNMADGNDYAGPSVGAFENDQVEDHWHGLNGHPTDQAAGTNYWNILATTPAGTHVVSESGTLKDAAGDSGRLGDETRPFNAGVKYCIKY